jgi:hypothetical protein
MDRMKNMHSKWIYSDPFVDRFESPELKQALDIWTSLRTNDQLPQKNQLVPFGLRQHLGWLVLADIRESPTSWKCTVFGSNLAQIFGRDLTGQPLVEAYPDPYWSDLQSAVSDVVSSRSPRRFTILLAPSGKEFVASRAICLPLSDGTSNITHLFLRNIMLSAKEIVEDWK